MNFSPDERHKHEVITINTPQVLVTFNQPVDLDLVYRKLNKIMATQQDAAGQLAATGAKLDKISGETTGLVGTVRDLKQALADAVAAGQTVDPALQAAVDSLASKADAIDALVDDVAPNPTDTPVPAADPVTGDNGGNTP